MKVKVTLEYWGNWTDTKTENYRVAKIDGAPVVEIQIANGYKVARIGEMITEAQALELSKRVMVFTGPKKS